MGLLDKLAKIISEEMEKRNLKLDKDCVNVFRFNDCIVFYYYDEDEKQIKLDVESLGTHNFFEINQEVLSFE